MNLIKKHINMNYSKGVKITPKYIVIHETDNTNKGADSNAHFNYWNTNINAQSSVHFVVDDKQAIQLLELNERAWHVGDNRGHSDITNSNSIGIEICVNSDGNFNKAFGNCIELVQYLMKQTKIPLDRVVRHYDASGKNCPRNIIATGKWQDFKNKVSGKVANKAQGGNNMATMASMEQAKKYVGGNCKELQIKLNKLGYNAGNADGVFGRNTYNALTDFQHRVGLEIDGYAGKSTFDKLDELIRATFKAELINFSVPQEFIANKEYTISANATSSNKAMYKFWLQNESDWLKLNEYKMDNKQVVKIAKEGKYRLVVHVRDTQSKRPYDDYKYVDVVVKDNKKEELKLAKKELNDIIAKLQNVIKRI